MAEDRSLPGWPKKKLVKDVRSYLAIYGVHPTRRNSTDGIWRDTWEWASKIAVSYYTKHWPIPTEIAAQYILLTLCKIRDDSIIRRLPHRAKEQMPQCVSMRLAAPPSGGGMLEYQVRDA